MTFADVRPVIFLVGPTAVGKTELSLTLADHLNAEIISCDSMQVYREVSIASSKPSIADQKKVPHHLLDVVSVEDTFDAARFNKLALAAIQTVQSRNRIPLIVGGSGMYMQILLDGLFDNRGVTAETRKMLIERVDQEGLPKLYEELSRVDPAASAKIHSHDARRIIRALEVYHATLTPISQLQKTRSGLWGTCPVKIIGLNRDRTLLYDRINRRVEDMFAEGLIDEIKGVLKKPLSLTAQRIIGVREVEGFLNKEYDLPKAKDLMKMNTRRLAKRQLTWFRKEQRLAWLDLDQETTESAKERILNLLAK